MVSVLVGACRRASGTRITRTARPKRPLTAAPNGVVATRDVHVASNGRHSYNHDLRRGEEGGHHDGHPRSLRTPVERLDGVRRGASGARALPRRPGDPRRSPVLQGSGHRQHHRHRRRSRHARHRRRERRHAAARRGASLAARCAARRRRLLPPPRRPHLRRRPVRGGSHGARLAATDRLRARRPGAELRPLQEDARMEPGDQHPPVRTADRALPVVRRIPLPGRRIPRPHDVPSRRPHLRAAPRARRDRRRRRGRGSRSAASWRRATCSSGPRRMPATRRRCSASPASGQRRYARWRRSTPRR